MSVRLHESPQGDMVEVIAPTPGAQSALDAHFADQAVLPLDSKEGKERFIHYLKDTIALSTPGGPITLMGGGIRVDAHQIVVRLRTERVRPESAHDHD